MGHLAYLGSWRLLGDDGSSIESRQPHLDECHHPSRHLPKSGCKRTTGRKDRTRLSSTDCLSWTKSMPINACYVVALHYHTVDSRLGTNPGSPWRCIQQRKTLMPTSYAMLTRHGNEALRTTELCQKASHTQAQPRSQLGSRRDPMFCCSNPGGEERAPAECQSKYEVRLPWQTQPL